MPHNQGDASHAPDSRGGAFTSVLRGLASARLNRSPPPATTPTPPIASDGLSARNASTTSVDGLITGHDEILEQLQRGKIEERIAAASAFRYAMLDYPVVSVRFRL